jgi:hypothetical protein
MKRLTVLIIMMFLLSVLSVQARGNRDFQDDNGNKAIDNQATDQPDRQALSHGKQAGAAHQPVVINMNRPSSGGHNQNFPSQQQQQPALQQSNNVPSYGKLQWNSNNQAKQRVQRQPLTRTFQSNNRPNDVINAGTKNQRPAVNTFSNSAVKEASVAHHHPYEPNYVRKKLQKLGVKSAPGYITSRAEIIHTDREHSRINLPKTGFDNHPLNAAAISSRHFNDKVVRSQMSMIGNTAWQDRVRGFDRTETHANHYYWHNYKNFSYCHYIDNVGYHWYGWYMGNKYFWTRHFNNRWWWYDVDFDRWCFWNNGFWWWQDPYHMGDLYCYNDTVYIPCNSAEDNVAVALPDNANIRTFASPDNSRTVKVVADTQDAFLYDASNPPQFNPVYLASGVQDVMFSDTNNGKPLEVILKLNDGSFNMFDGDGNPYNAAASSEGGQANQGIE